ncbi:unnamed protein product [Penicillium olsonii]|uniref:DNA-directed RNA polymerase n=1 Tax=Penicillium olsonii TaxID=99116 RepID=A0A9W4MTX5_PENOL|nr:unnamed protein product [Penicillium olsonii]CAG8138770.1 unnamed protein product [Penicillium olsonii]
MLSRVARSKHAFLLPRRAQALRASVSLPTTYLHSYSSNRTPLVNSSSHALLDRARKPSLQSERHLATAADPSSIDAQPADSYDQFMNMPFESKDLSSLVIIDSAPQSHSKIFRRRHGIGGDETEMMANLDMSLKIGQYERASGLITRLGHYHPPGSLEYLALHNRFLSAMVQHMIITRDPSMVLPVQKWFEVDMRSSEVVPDAKTFACMIRMSLRMLHGAQRDRAVRRYWELAQTAGLEEEIVGLEILEDSDVGELSKICSSDMLDLISKYLDLSELDNAQPVEPTIDDDTPQVMAANLKGHGLSSLRKSLASFGKEISLPANFSGTEEEAKALLSEMKQRQLETDSLDSAINRWRQDQEQRQKAGATVESDGKKLSNLMGQWHTDLVPRIKKEVEMYEQDLLNPITSIEQKDRCEYGVFLKALDPDRLAAIAVLGVLGIFSRQGMSKGLKLSNVASGLGKEVQDEIIADSHLQKTKITNPNRLKAVKELLANRKDKDGRPRWNALVEKMATEDQSILWGSRVTVRVGSVLMAMLLEEAKVSLPAVDPSTKKTTFVSQPAFSHAYSMHYGKRTGLIHMNSALVEMVSKEPLPEVVARHLPMLTTPKPWTGVRSGGYLLYENSIVRSTPGELLQPAYLKAVLKNDGLKEVRSGLDVLSSTGWKINQPVFDVMLEAWNAGDAIGKLAPVDLNLPTPEPPAPDATYAQQSAYSRKMREIENLRSGFHSVRCFQNFQMEVARAFRKQTFYLPHNMDFRGRAYPLPPYLNQMGADNSRGLLLFDEGRPLGTAGLRWLKIHLANLYGFDKASMSEREQFTMDNLDAVLDSANKGLHGQRWWLQGEDPWQLLAACCELRNALLLPDPTQYVSHLPIHQDGSCNGLQHYAALGGDKAGAEQVNLEPSDRPSDVYTGVCEFVKADIAEDAANGLELAVLLNGRVTRKIVKQTVMTNVYGVTFLGATRQVKRQLVEYIPELTPAQRTQAAVYVARKIFGALGTMFNGAHEIQYWFGDCAYRITQSLTPQQVDELTEQAMQPKSGASTSMSADPEKSFKSTVIWTTPLGLPVVQPYRTRRARRVQTSMQDINILDPGVDDVIQKRKQLQAFPPNFIHSLDATHMILSANACREAGMTFSAVHDSFWTHAADVDQMNLIIRDSFVRMHSDDVVGRLAAEFRVRYGKNFFLARVPRNGKFGKAIATYRNTSKNTKLQELIQEKQRQSLLNSEDPDDRREGQAMVTPASIFEDMDGRDEDLTIFKTLGQNNIGHIPEDININSSTLLPSIDLDPTDPAIQSLVGDVDLFEGKISSQEADDCDEMEVGDSKPKSKGPRMMTTWLWLPLNFREVPQKGDWDVTRIRQSEYFFS